MTLYKQLVAFTLLVFTVLFAGIFYEKQQSTRDFILKQMESHAQDTATSLALSIIPVMDEEDLSTAEAMINAVFDGGFYKRIVFKDIEGEILIDRQEPITLDGVPEWFVSLVPIETPNAEAMINSGWVQVGNLYVESHPGYAYRTIWQDVVKMGSFFLIAGLMVLISVTVALRIMLNPLKRVQLQAEAICRKEYRIQEKLPRTKELRQVVVSMNKMTMQVREMFAGQAKVAEKLGKKAYGDQLTGLGNRRYITGQVEAHLAAKKGMVQGAFLLLQIDGLQKINKIEGFDVADKFLKEIASNIKKETQMLKGVALARLTGGDFAIFLAEVSSDVVSKIADNLSNKVPQVATEMLEDSKDIVNIGGVFFESAPKLSLLLAEADNALQASRQKGSNQWLVNELNSGEENEVKGKQWWKETLDRVLEKGEIILFSQPVVAGKNHSKIFHQELLSRIVLDSGEVVSAGMFIPIAERLNVMSKLDKVVLNQVFRDVRTHDNLRTIAINLSPASISDGEFVSWLLKELSRLPTGKSHLIFEFPEFGAVQRLDEIKEFATKVQALGHGIALDHFGQSFSNFGYLKSLRPEYVKIDRAFTKELESGEGDSEFFIEALCGVAHTLGVEVIAEGVEVQEQVDHLLDLNIDALQGYLFGKPAQI